MFNFLLALFLPLLISVYTCFPKMVLQANTDKISRKMSVLQGGVPPPKRSKVLEIVKENITLPSEEFIPIDDLVTIAAFRLKDVHTWSDLMNARVEDLDLLNSEKAGPSDAAQV